MVELPSNPPLGHNTTTLQHPKFHAPSSESLSLADSSSTSLVLTLTDGKLLGFADFLSAYRWIKEIGVSMSSVARENNAKEIAA
ncbi:hypothetical protein Csa_007225 [Cucumis sativus]|nr:hypothetical protein Csa_007225 [Cucumis sativus]